ncbi:PhoX family phosphatase [Photobacterium sp. MCCC 1A19761]|uniref:PhoX family protein n=1 Tax=Photobacterium sp. MCCC 1A19761 TaxID=3115000 RepID=UPI00307F9B98
MSKAVFDPKRYNRSENTSFDEVLDAFVSRRKILKGGMGLSAMAAMGAFGLTGCNSSSDSTTAKTGETIQPISLKFESIPGALTDAVHVADGYTAQVLAPWGTPLNGIAQAWQNDGSNTAMDQANAVGMNHDGLHFFPLNGSATEGLLCVNHEYIEMDELHQDKAATFDPDGSRNDVDAVRKEIFAHGVSVIHIALEGDQWMVKQDVRNRRYTGASTMDIAGPLAHTKHVVTPFSPDGSQARGTLNNCGNGYTPWGTYLTCEENWPGYFVNQGTITADQERIGIVSGTGARGRYRWETLAGNADERLDEFRRFDVTPTGASELSDYRNEANGHGYIVEIDPYRANSRAVKRTALGRFRHEGCTFGTLEAGKPLVFYSGHDSRFEYMYKFVSDALWDPADADSVDRLGMGDKYMNEGTLYVARFDADGKGVWLPLKLDGITKDNGTLADHFSTQAEIILNTAGAADLVGATPMDRPEWCAVDPITGSVYLTLTNNTRRTEDTGTNPANPRLKNKFGHVIRWDETENHTDFSWDIFVFGSAADASEDINLSGLDEMNQFASPDGLAFDSRGILWIQTDNGAAEVANYTNDQMLAVVPSNLKDADGKQETIGAANQGELKRFFVGPNGCEVTGFTISPDHRAMFVSIQHPGNWPYSDNAAEATPAGTTVRARASIVVIRRQDGGELAV